MNKITVKVPAKLNLTLDVSSGVNGYHNIRSLVTTVSIYDVITLEKREDKEITLVEKGIVVGGDINDNNAVKAAKLFMEKAGVNGVNITIEKSIPIGAGLGGSSADIAGVLYAMRLLYRRYINVESLANALGSDCAYMLRGGFAIISGRGDKIEKVEGRYYKNYHFVVIPDEVKILAKDAYKWFDELKEKPLPSTDNVVNLLKSGEVFLFLQAFKNDLYLGVKERYPHLQKKLDDLEKACADPIMTGSGSAVFGAYSSNTLSKWACKRLSKIYDNVITCKYVSGIKVIEKS